MREKGKENVQEESQAKSSPNQNDCIERTIKSDNIEVTSLSKLDLSLVVKGFE